MTPFASTLRILTAPIGRFLFGSSFMFDIINACSFRCPSCPIGFEKLKPGAMMDVGTFREILDKIQDEETIRYILLYSFSEPLLHPHIGAFVQAAKQVTNRVMISTNLSHPHRAEACFAAGLTEFRISFSGFKHGEYFHKGRDMKQFVEACYTVSDLLAYYPDTKVSLIFHEYKTTLPELPKVSEFARNLGFNLIREPAFFIGWEKIVNHSYTDQDTELISHLQYTPEEATANLRRQEYCYYQLKQMVFDANGDAYLCRHVYDPDKFGVGNIKKNTLKEIRRAMKHHSFCVKCKDAKLNTFAP